MADGFSGKQDFVLMTFMIIPFNSKSAICCPLVFGLFAPDAILRVFLHVYAHQRWEQFR